FPPTATTPLTAGAAAAPPGVPSACARCAGSRGAATTSNTPASVVSMSLPLPLDGGRLVGFHRYAQHLALAAVLAGQPDSVPSRWDVLPVRRCAARLPVQRDRCPRAHKDRELAELPGRGRGWSRRTGRGGVGCARRRRGSSRRWRGRSRDAELLRRSRPGWG